jgi:hypothetical protein
MFEDMQGVTEPMPIDDVFVTGLCKIEDLGNGLARWWCYAQERQTKIIRCKLVIPVVCAAVMTLKSTEVFARMMRDCPQLARLIH